MILFKSIKYLLFEYAINAFFDKVTINFSNFDLLGGSRQFKHLVMEYKIGSDTHRKIYGDVKIIELRESSNRKFKYKMKIYRSGPYGIIVMYFNEIVKCIPGEYLEVISH